MKISKQPKAVKASMMTPDTTVIGQPTSVATQNCPYQQAQDFIKSAINCLTTVAAENTVAKDSIANLAVVLLDLQGA